jgi:hypothetical protein
MNLLKSAWDKVYDFYTDIELDIGSARKKAAAIGLAAVVGTGILFWKGHQQAVELRNMLAFQEQTCNCKDKDHYVVTDSDVIGLKLEHLEEKLDSAKDKFRKDFYKHVVLSILDNLEYKIKNTDFSEIDVEQLPPIDKKRLRSLGDPFCDIAGAESTLDEYLMLDYEGKQVVADYHVIRRKNRDSNHFSDWFVLQEISVDNLGEDIPVNLTRRDELFDGFYGRSIKNQKKADYEQFKLAFEKFRKRDLMRFYVEAFADHRYKHDEEDYRAGPRITYGEENEASVAFKGTGEDFFGRYNRNVVYTVSYDWETEVVTLLGQDVSQKRYPVLEAQQKEAERKWKNAKKEFKKAGKRLEEEDLEGAGKYFGRGLDKLK